MGRKFEVTGKAVIYTRDGAKIITAEVRRSFNANYDGLEFKYKFDEPHILIGGARTIPTDNIYAQNAWHPETVDFAFKYTQTKFFRFMIDAMRLAQWNPINKANYIMHGNFFTTNCFPTANKPDVDFSKSVAEIDEQFFRKYEFTSPMINFLEARYR